MNQNNFFTWVKGIEIETKCIFIDVFIWIEKTVAVAKKPSIIIVVVVLTTLYNYTNKIIIPYSQN